MANIWEKAISILAGNLNLGHRYLITTVMFFSLKEDNVTMVSLWPGPVKTEHIVEHVLSQGKFEIQISWKHMVNGSYMW